MMKITDYFKKPQSSSNHADEIGIINFEPTESENIDYHMKDSDSAGTTIDQNNNFMENDSLADSPHPADENNTDNSNLILASSRNADVGDQGTRRTFQNEWSKQFPWLIKLGENEDNVAFMQIEQLLRDTISYMTCHNNLVHLKKIAEILQEDLFMPRRIYEIRWLSRFYVIKNFVKSMPIILQFLEEKKPNDPIAKSFTSIDDFPNYGHHELKKLLRFYRQLSVIDDNIFIEWDMFKYTYLKPIMVGQNSTSWKNVLQLCIVNKEVFPNLIKIVAPC
uniref:Uncharacterized protein n=1 Tax=Romanomermis culicivorax TaxID=13658 RepID=A0A915HH42_ROMCU